jgi:hypothetical protein
MRSRAAVCIPLAEGQGLHLFAADTPTSSAPARTFSVKAAMTARPTVTSWVTIRP